MVDSKPPQEKQVEIIKNEFGREIESLRKNMFDVYMHYGEIEDRGDAYDLACSIYKYVDHDLEVMGGKGDDPHSDRVKKLNIGQNNLVVDLKNVEHKMKELRDKCRGEKFTDKRIGNYHTANPGEDVSMAVQRSIEIISQLTKGVSDHPEIDEKGQVSFFDTL